MWVFLRFGSEDGAGCLPLRWKLPFLAAFQECNGVSEGGVDEVAKQFVCRLVGPRSRLSSQASHNGPHKSLCYGGAQLSVGIRTLIWVSLGRAGTSVSMASVTRSSVSMPGHRCIVWDTSWPCAVRVEEETIRYLRIFLCPSEVLLRVANLAW